jgi:hypothetical protein
MVQMNPDKTLSLEETIISTMAPAQTFYSEPELDTGFKPVKEVVVGASVFQ